jgi:ABC-type branched-subunit amino acid transport system substrate-binding protein
VRLEPRRPTVLALAAALVVLVVGAGSAASSPTAKKEPFKFGFIATSTGSQATNFELARQGVIAAVRVANQNNLAGRPLEMTFADDAGSPQGAADACNRLINQEHVQAIIGFESTPARAACNPFLLSKNIPYVAGQPSAGDFCPTNMFLTGFIPNQQIGTMVKYLKKKGTSSVYFVGNNFSSAKTAQSLVSSLMGDGLVGTSYEPFGTTDWSGEISKIASSKAQAIVVILVGNDEVSFWKAVANDPRVSGLVKFDPLLTTANARATGPSIKGVFSTNTYFPALPNKQNAFYKKTIAKRYGSKAIADAQSVHLWEAVHILSKALKTSGSVDGAKIIAQLAQTSITGPSGTIRYTPTSKGFSVQNVFVGQADANANFKVLASYGRQAPVPTC